MTRKWLPLVAWLALCGPARAELIEETLTTPRPDGSPLQVMVSRPQASGKVPILMAIDGSLCLPSRSNAAMARLSPAKPDLGPYALVTVEKPEPSQPAADAAGSVAIGPDFRCSEAFDRYYSIDQRVLDHLHAIAHLRRHAGWWDGRLFLWGFSDGARIAGRVGTFTPETQRMVLGGFGGGASMATELEDFHICPRERTQDRDACVRDLRVQFQKMRDNPTSRETWLGDVNTWRTWASRLDSVEANVLEVISVPVLVFHGTEDRSVPVGSARLLAERLTAAGVQLVYREMQGMGHGLDSLPPGKAEELQRELLSWLLGSAPP